MTVIALILAFACLAWATTTFVRGMISGSDLFFRDSCGWAIACALFLLVAK